MDISKYSMYKFKNISLICNLIICIIIIHNSGSPHATQYVHLCLTIKIHSLSHVLSLIDIVAPVMVGYQTDGPGDARATRASDLKTGGLFKHPRCNRTSFTIVIAAVTTATLAHQTAFFTYPFSLLEQQSGLVLITRIGRSPEGRVLISQLTGRFQIPAWQLNLSPEPLP